MLTFGPPVLARDITIERLYDGKIGRLTLGDSKSSVERKLGHSIELTFAGEYKAGIEFESDLDLRALAISRFGDAKVEVAFLGFRIADAITHLDYVVLMVPCSAVRRFAQRASSAGANVKWSADAWETESSKRKYAWGAERKPICRFWFREDRQDK